MSLTALETHIANLALPVTSADGKKEPPYLIWKYVQKACTKTCWHKLNVKCAHSAITVQKVQSLVFTVQKAIGWTHRMTNYPVDSNLAFSVKEASTVHMAEV